MKRRKCFITVVVLAAAILCLGTWALADSHQITLTPTVNEGGASGTAMLSPTELSIEAMGLHPSSVYTVWFVNMVPKKMETGVGEAPYKFETDDKGNGTYAASFGEDPKGKWQMLMVVLHPDGDPTNMDTVVEALSAELPMM